MRFLCNAVKLDRGLSLRPSRALFVTKNAASEQSATTTLASDTAQATARV
jgi:hypothetical protein